MAYPLTKSEIEQFMNEGYEAFINGAKISALPYSKFSQQGRLWTKGYANAAYGSKHAVAIR